MKKDADQTPAAGKTLASLMDSAPFPAPLPEMQQAGDAGMETVVTGLTADSREVRPGMLFAALAGSKADGSAFVPAAVAAGASVVLAGTSCLLPPLPAGVTVLRSAEPRVTLALLAAAFFPPAPATVTAVTGTNGKTSTACFTRQIWQRSGLGAGSLGTLGLTTARHDHGGSMTTPDPVTLHRLLAEAAADGTTHLCMEASSHGLDQHRLDGVRLAAAAFTNLTRDHLDYHGTEEACFLAKQRLFTEVLPGGRIAVLNADSPWFPRLQAATLAAGRQVMTFGRAGNDIRLESSQPTLHGQVLELDVHGVRHSVELPLAGDFQAANAMAALGLVIASGGDPDTSLAALETLEGVPGRLELVGQTGSAGSGPEEAAAVLVDYAHTPDALETALRALRPHTLHAGHQPGKLRVVFGCGGDRDRGKRPLMAALACSLADQVIVTDDNPRSEDAAAIRQEVLAGCPPETLASGQVTECGDRRQAIDLAIRQLLPGDVLLIAGKGHESGQIMGDTVLPFDDRQVARHVLRQLAAERRTSGTVPASGSEAPLWTASAIAAATGGLYHEDFACTGISIDSRTVAPGDLFIALCGPSHDGHDWVAGALEKGAAGALVHRLPDGVDPARLVVTGDTFDALNALGRAARQRFHGQVIAVTGSVGKTSSKEMLALALSTLGRTHAAVGSFNNHWGVPLTLARMPADADYAVIEMGMNHSGEITTLTALARPQVAVITTIAPAHIEHLGSLEAIADAKAEIFASMQPGDTAILPLEAPCADRLEQAARQAGLKICRFGRGEAADARLLSSRPGREQTDITVSLPGYPPLSCHIGSVGEHWAMNATAVLAAISAACPADPAIPRLAGAALARMTPPKGRGQRLPVALAPAPGDDPASGGTLLVIDESYNANPLSMQAAFAALAAVPLDLPAASGHEPPGGQQGRRIVVIGDMLELGEESAQMHRQLATAITAAGLDLVYSCGTLMEHMYNALPPALRGGHAADSSALAPVVTAAVRPGDVVMVKGSAGSRMRVVVDALLALKTPPSSGTVPLASGTVPPAG